MRQQTPTLLQLSALAELDRGIVNMQHVCLPENTIFTAWFLALASIFALIFKKGLKHFQNLGNKQ
jgi:hypothetical protein